jgi:hypothetical protein
MEDSRWWLGVILKFYVFHLILSLFGVNTYLKPLKQSTVPFGSDRPLTFNSIPTHTTINFNLYGCTGSYITFGHVVTADGWTEPQATL